MDKDIDQLESLNIGGKQFLPNADSKDTLASYEGWKKAVQQLL